MQFTARRESAKDSCTLYEHREEVEQMLGNKE